MKASLTAVAAFVLLAGGVPTTSGAPCTTDLPTSIAGMESFAGGCEFHMAGNVEVLASGILAIADASVVVDGPFTLTIRGSLQLDNVTFATVGNTLPYRLVLAPSATTSLVNSTLAGYSDMVVKSDDVALENVTLSAARTALRVEGGRVEARGLTVSQAVIGTHILGDANVLLIGASFLPGVSIPVMLAANGTASPTLRLLDTPIQPAPWIPAGGQVQRLARATVTVTGASDAVVLSADRDGVMGVPWIQAGAGRFEALLPDQIRTQTASFSPGPYLVWAKSGSLAASTVLSLPVPATPPSLHLAGVADTAAPSWGASSLRQTTPVESGSFSLAWSPPGEAGAVAWYEVWRDNATSGAKRLSWAVDGRDVQTSRVLTSAALALNVIGDQSFVVRAYDLVGNHADSNSVDINLTAPALAASLVGTEIMPELYAAPVRLQVSAEDGVALSTQVNGKAPVGYLGPISFGRQSTIGEQSFPSDGNYSIEIHAKEGELDDELPKRLARSSMYFMLDMTPPALQATLVPALAQGTWSSTPFTLVADAQDSLSGVTKIEYSLDAGKAWKMLPANGSARLDLAKGLHTIQVRATDRAGHSATTSLAAAYDPDAPKIRLVVPPATGRAGWHLGQVNVSVEVDAGTSGPPMRSFRVDGGPWAAASDVVRIATSGTHTAEVRVTTAAEVVVSNQTTIRIDLEAPVPPQPRWTWQGDVLHADWAASPAFDAGSGIERIFVEDLVDGEPAVVLELPATATAAEVIDLSPGDHEVRVRVRDVAGREAASAWQSKSQSLPAEEPLKQVATGIMVLAPANASGIREARFYVDGQLVASLGAAPFVLDWDTRDVRDGIHKVVVVTVDADGGLHQEAIAFEVRNSYAKVLGDRMLPFATALASLGLVAVAAIGSLRRPRGAA